VPDFPDQMPARNGSVVVTGEQPYTSVMITGAGGYVGHQLVAALAATPGAVRTIVASDVRLPAEQHLAAVEYVSADVCSADLAGLFDRFSVDLVVHLAAIVTPGPGSSRALEYQVDVVGTQRVVDACVATGVRKIIYASSGAAYGYHADNPAWLNEDDPLRGNAEFAYAHNKRLVEEMLARRRSTHPELLQLIFRPGVILGRDAHNQITDLFARRVVLGISRSESPFVIVWDQDVIGAILHGIHRGGTGIFNLAGDGTLTLREMARLMGKRYVPMPAGLIGAALALLKGLHLTQYGPEQVRFLQHRPVLDNRRLKQELGYIPRKTTREAFTYFLEAQDNGTSA
jgi:UDP-glucose 4-epimerase